MRIYVTGYITITYGRFAMPTIWLIGNVISSLVYNVSPHSPISQPHVCQYNIAEFKQTTNLLGALAGFPPFLGLAHPSYR